MNNKLLSVLILIGMAGAGYLYYSLKYLPDKQAKIQAEIQKQEEAIKIGEEPKLTKQVVEEIQLSKAQKIDEIKESSKNYKTIKLDNFTKAYFVKNENGLDLFYNKKKIGNFKLVYPQYLRVEKIDGTNDDLYVEVGTEKFYYNHKTKDIQKVDLNIDVNYIKVGPYNKLIFVTSKGSFIYSIFDKTLDYFSYFNDFVYYNEGYIGLVGKDEERVLNNLGFVPENNNLVVYYNSDTKEKNIVYKTDLEIKKIYVNNNKVYLVTGDDDVFELENL